MPTELTAMIAKHRKAGKPAKKAEKLAIKEYNAKFPGKAVGLKTDGTSSQPKKKTAKKK